MDTGLTKRDPRMASNAEDTTKRSITILSVLLALLFLWAGLTKLMDAEYVVQHRGLWGLGGRGVYRESNPARKGR